MELLYLLLLAVIALTIYKFKEWNFYFQQTYKVDNDLDLITNLLDDIECDKVAVKLTEYTIKVMYSDETRYIWISNHPYSYGHYYSHHDAFIFDYKGIKYDTYKRVRKLHDHLLNLQEQQRKDKITNEFDVIIQKLRDRRC